MNASTLAAGVRSESAMSAVRAPIDAEHVAEDLDVEPLLALEVVVDHRLVEAGGLAAMVSTEAPANPWAANSVAAAARMASRVAPRTLLHVVLP